MAAPPFSYLHTQRPAVYSSNLQADAVVPLQLAGAQTRPQPVNVIRFQHDLFNRCWFEAAANILPAYGTPALPPEKAVELMTTIFKTATDTRNIRLDDRSSPYGAPRGIEAAAHVVTLAADQLGYSTEAKDLHAAVEPGTVGTNVPFEEEQPLLAALMRIQANHASAPEQTPHYGIIMNTQAATAEAATPSGETRAAGAGHWICFRLELTGKTATLYEIDANRCRPHITKLRPQPPPVIQYTYQWTEPWPARFIEIIAHAAQYAPESSDAKRRLAEMGYATQTMKWAKDAKLFKFVPNANVPSYADFVLTRYLDELRDTAAHSPHARAEARAIELVLSNSPSAEEADRAVAQSRARIGMEAHAAQINGHIQLLRQHKDLFPHIAEDEIQRVRARAQAAAANGTLDSNTTQTIIDESTARLTEAIDRQTAPTAAAGTDPLAGGAAAARGPTPETQRTDPYRDRLIQQEVQELDRLISEQRLRANRATQRDAARIADRIAEYERQQDTLLSHLGTPGASTTHILV